MAQYVEVKGQTIEFPDGMPMADIESAIKSNMLSIKPIEAKPIAAPSKAEKILRGIKDPLDVGAKLFERMMPDSFNNANHAVNNWIADKTGLLAKVPENNLTNIVLGGGKTGVAGLIEQQEKDYQARRKSGGESGFDGYRTIGNVAATYPIGGALAAPLKTIAPRFAAALGSGGFSTGGKIGTTLAEKAADMGIRMAGGAVTGAASSGAVGDDMKTGALIGGLLPPVAKVAGLTGSAIGSGVRALLTPEQQAMAVKIASMTGQKIEDVIQGLQDKGPSILGIKPTVPQMLQDDAISQLQRTVQNAGDKSLRAREVAQNAERLAGMERIAPIANTVNEAADVAGNAISSYGKAQRAAATKDVTRRFEGADPFNETLIELPIDAMKAAKEKFQGIATFGKGTAAQDAIKTAERVGTQVLPGIDALKGSGASQSLEQAVRAAGGIKGTSGELRDLGIKQSGTTGLINNKSGKPLDLLAEDMHARGFIPDSDPATLLDAIRNKGGRDIFAHDMGDSGMRKGIESAMGDAPTSEVISKAIPLKQVQDLRGSLNEAWKEASLRGRTQEAAALQTMIGEIDSKIQAVANGGGNVGEVMPADIAKNYYDAIAAHAAKKTRFDTGPQARMFREGGDGQAAIQGAEVPREFFNSRASQIEDAQSFKRLIEQNPDLTQALKTYALTDAAQQTTKDGLLSLAKFDKWMKGHSGALKETMTPSDNALLKEVLQGVRAADIGALGGIAKGGSNTKQNIDAADRLLGLGLLDSPVVNYPLQKIPFGVGSSLSGMLDAVRKTAKETKAEKIGGLLSDPDLLRAELENATKGGIKNNAVIKGLLSDPRFQAIKNDPRIKGLLSELPASAYRATPVLAQ